MKEDVHVRIGEELMRGVRAYAAAREISLAAAINILLRRALYEELP